MFVSGLKLFNVKRADETTAPLHPNNDKKKLKFFRNLTGNLKKLEPDGQVSNNLGGGGKTFHHLDHIFGDDAFHLF